MEPHNRANSGRNATSAKALRRKAEEEARQLADELLLGHEVPACKERSDRVETMFKVAEHLGPKRPELWPALVIAIVCLSVAAFLRVSRRSVVALQMEIVATSIDAQLATEMRMHDRFPVTRLSVDRISTVYAPALDIDVRAPSTNAWMLLTDAPAQVNDIRLSKGSSLKLRANVDALELYTTGEFTAELSLDGKVKLSHGVGGGVRSHRAIPPGQSIPESIVLRAAAGRQIPTTFRFVTKNELQTDDLRLRMISFVRDKGGEPYPVSFQSTIESGTITLLDVSVTKTLRRGDRLTVEGIECKRASIAAGQAIRLTFEGTVSRLLLGPEGYEENLAPSLIEYLYHQKPTGYFWGAVAFLWAILYGIRETVFRRK